MGYSFLLAAKYFLYALSHRLDNTMSLGMPVIVHWLEQEKAQMIGLLKRFGPVAEDVFFNDSLNTFYL